MTLSGIRRLLLRQNKNAQFLFHDLECIAEQTHSPVQHSPLSALDTSNPAGPETAKVDSH